MIGIVSMKVFPEFAFCIRGLEILRRYRRYNDNDMLLVVIIYIKRKENKNYIVMLKLKVHLTLTR